MVGPFTLAQVLDIATSLFNIVKVVIPVLFG